MFEYEFIFGDIIFIKCIIKRFIRYHNGILSKNLNTNDKISMRNVYHICIKVAYLIN